jgi:FkbM family methyltransferase
LKSPAERANGFLRRHQGVHRAFNKLSVPARNAPLPVLVGNGRGLRLCSGDSTMLRLLSSVEPEVESTLLGLLEPGETVFDVGANIGWFSLLAARKVGPSGRVVAFEPSIANAAYCKRNAASNGFANITVIPAAVGDRDGWASFAAGSSLKGRLSDEGGDEVPIISLDTWLTATGQAPPQLIKLDIEGAEGAALRGMSETLRAERPALIIELHDTNAEVADLLDAAGYEHRPIDHDGSTRDAPWWVHVLAMPT